MRIAIVYLGRRGAGGRITLELARALSCRHKMLVLLSRRVENAEDWQGLAVERLHVDTYRGALGALASLSFPSQIRNVADLIRQFAPDVLLLPIFHPWNGRIQRILAEIPSLVFVHDPRPHPDLAGWFYARLENSSIRRATRCAVLSESLSSPLAGRGGDPARIDVIPLGPFSYDTYRPEEKGQVPTLLFFGRIVPYKGLQVLLQAFEVLRRSIRCRLLIVGEGDMAPYRDVLASLQDVDLVNRWIREDEIAGFFARSDAVVLPYTSASQSGVIPIAAPFALPVIATRTGGLPEQVENGVSGWLVDAGDASALASAMREALLNPVEARRRGEALKNRYETQFGWEQIVRRVEQSLELAIQEHGQNSPSIRW